MKTGNRVVNQQQQSLESTQLMEQRTHMQQVRDCQCEETLSLQNHTHRAARPTCGDGRADLMVGEHVDKQEHS